MNRKDSKQIAETITNEEILVMLSRAKDRIKDWTQTSRINKNMTIGTAWNILTRDFNVENNIPNLHKVNLIREFGDYLPTHLKIKKETNISEVIITHQIPNLNNIK